MLARELHPFIRTHSVVCVNLKNNYCWWNIICLNHIWSRKLYRCLLFCKIEWKRIVQVRDVDSCMIAKGVIFMLNIKRVNGLFSGKGYFWGWQPVKRVSYDLWNTHVSQWLSWLSGAHAMISQVSKGDLTAGCMLVGNIPGAWGIVSGSGIYSQPLCGITPNQSGHITS